MSSIDTPTRPRRRVQYPESDGKPLGETDQHRTLMTDLIFALKWFLSNVRAYIAGNLFVYFEEGNPRAVVAPDVFVVLGVEQRQRRVFQAWREDGRLPDVVIELTSKKTSKADQTLKPALYAQLGVREYFIFDPYGEYLRPQLQGFRLVDGGYQPMDEFPLRSALLGLELRQEESALRLYNSRTGERLPTSDEEVLARRAAEAARADAEKQLAAEAAAPPRRGPPNAPPKLPPRSRPAAPPRRGPPNAPPKLPPRSRPAAPPRTSWRVCARSCAGSAATRTAVDRNPLE
jgi:Uma2 family endonuclease